MCAPDTVANLDAIAIAEVLDKVGEILTSYRYRYDSESILQDGIERALVQHEIRYLREKTLTRLPGIRTVPGLHDRPDFMIGSVALEVKIKGSLSAMLRQLSRYAQHPDVGAILAVGTPSWMTRIPSSLNGKEIRCVWLVSSLFL